MKYNLCLQFKRGGISKTNSSNTTAIKTNVHVLRLFIVLILSKVNPRPLYLVSLSSTCSRNMFSGYRYTHISLSLLPFQWLWFTSSFRTMWGVFCLFLAFITHTFFVNHCFFSGLSLTPLKFLFKGHQWSATPFFFLRCVACGIFDPNQGLNLSLLHWKCRVLTSRPPGKPHQCPWD